MTDDLIGDTAVCDEFDRQADMFDHGIVVVLTEHGDHFCITAGLDGPLAFIAGTGDLLDTRERYITVERCDPLMGLLYDFHQVTSR